MGYAGRRTRGPESLPRGARASEGPAAGYLFCSIRPGSHRPPRPWCRLPRVVGGRGHQGGYTPI